ncbi:6,7-dimethyl-8-ribityllumazine synthase [Filimonas lacunae]|uniref:6,7-dimethyl-8-ribityllumazine synthase n=1 Tax=Filimonas lacunae TaxID=477680 RepID=A0A173MKT7_9BACT|nr:6,7-dimethyl-8-ribityllumazine synthase [Filimonas lacunae]BAV08086.1 6,7-dimethyl-8-ribityllumazine synthase [Filimonas lacunae]SIT09106.1 6,7-dimethyl-8-ribityllumazine synthase [Filimonas lacunae]
MATQGNNALLKGIPTTKDAFVVIVKTEWNAPIINKLEAGAKKVFKAAGVTVKVLTVPGAFEIPYAIKAYAESGEPKADAFIAFGTVIRGDTPHFDYVCKAITDGVLSLNLTLEVPVVFGVLTVENEQQALERVGGKHGHKGEEAAVTAIKMIALKRKLKK